MNLSSERGSSTTGKQQTGEKRKSSSPEKQQPEKKMKLMEPSDDASVKEWKTNLQNSLDRILPTTQMPYENVSVIAVKFSNDDMDLAGIEDELCKIFENLYHYRVEKYTVDASVDDRKATSALRNKLTNFQLTYGGERSLLIFVYSGHAGFAPVDDIRGDRDVYHLSGALHEGSLAKPIIPWNTVSAAILHDGDALFILDTCYAGTAAFDTSAGEVLAACNWSSAASADVNVSFTSALCHALKRKAGDPNTTTGNVYAAINQESQQAKTKLEEQPIFQPHAFKGNIQLQPLSSASGYAASSSASTGMSRNLEQKRVLVSVKLDTDYESFDLAEFKTWVTTNIPSHVFEGQVDVEVHSVHKGTVILLMFLPFELWAYLQFLPYVRLIDYVKSGNSAAEEKAGKAEAEGSGKDKVEKTGKSQEEAENIPSSSSSAVKSPRNQSSSLGGTTEPSSELSAPDVKPS